MGKKFKNKDIAAKLGVSGTLVSLVLNNKADIHGIRKDTQEKVLALARQMGYFNTPSEPGVSSPVEEKPGIIGMIVPSSADPFVNGISPYLQKAFSDIGVGFSIITKDSDDQRFDRMVGAFKKFFSGLILLGEAADENTIRSLRTTDYPFVILEKSLKSGRFNSVCTDTLAAAQMVANHIKNLGYKNIIIVTERKSAKWDMTLIDAIESALRLKSETIDSAIVELEQMTNDNDLDFTQFESLLRPPFRADVIICLHSLLVYPIMGFLRKRKLRVPQDIAIISMEECAGFDLVFTPVTCIRKPLPGIAVKVANMIWSEIRNSGKGKFKRQVNISPELIIRNSCGTL